MSALAALVLRDMRIALRVGGGALIGVLVLPDVVTLCRSRSGPTWRCCAHRPGDPVARRAAREPARARPAVRRRPRGRLARPDPDAPDAARAGAARPRRSRIGSPPGLPLVIATPLLGLLLNLEPTRPLRGRAHAAGRHAGADLHRPDRRGAGGDAAPRRAAAGGAGSAADDSGADLRRRRDAMPRSPGQRRSARRSRSCARCRWSAS